MSQSASVQRVARAESTAGAERAGRGVPSAVWTLERVDMRDLFRGCWAGICTGRPQTAGQNWSGWDASVGSRPVGRRRACQGGRNRWQRSLARECPPSRSPLVGAGTMVAVLGLPALRKLGPRSRHPVLRQARQPAVRSPPHHGHHSRPKPATGQGARHLLHPMTSGTTFMSQTQVPTDAFPELLNTSPPASNRRPTAPPH